MSDVDFLRETAQMMREQARLATYPNSRWDAGERCVWADDVPVVSDGDTGDGGCYSFEVADFIAAWDPTTALAVADLVEVGVVYANLPGRSEYPPFTAAMAAAKAYRRQS